MKKSTIQNKQLRSQQSRAKRGAAGFWRGEARLEKGAARLRLKEL
jgi:hypothetical protein